MPTDQHAATGTCELGERDIRIATPDHKCFVSPKPHFFAWPIRSEKMVKKLRRL